MKLVEWIKGLFAAEESKEDSPMWGYRTAPLNEDLGVEPQPGVTVTVENGITFHKHSGGIRAVRTHGGVQESFYSEHGLIWYTGNGDELSCIKGVGAELRAEYKRMNARKRFNL